ncbi:unnamed protein product [Musa acuminata subsp. burmannicoides]
MSTMRRPMIVKSTRLIREVKNGQARLGKQQHGAVNDASWWIPHPRTGIYYPKGHEWVMEDVPEGASSFPRTYWLRSAEGVEKDSDLSTCPDYNHPYLDV